MNRKRTIVIAAAALAALAVALGISAILDGRWTVAGEPAALGNGMLDMVLIDIEDQDAATHYHVDALGVYVLAVDQESQVYAAGVRSGDRIVSANGIPVSSTGEFGMLRAGLDASGELEMVLERSQEEESFTVTLVDDAQ